MKCEIVYINEDESNDYDIDYDINNDNVIPVMGGDSSNPSWDEYLSGWFEDIQPKIKAIRQCIEDNDLVGVCANEICNDVYFKFEDGTIMTFTWRAWGDLMQAIINKREGYMTYYYKI